MAASLQTAQRLTFMNDYQRTGTCSFPRHGGGLFVLSFWVILGLMDIYALSPAGRGAARD